jgi:hypothetical protein
MGITKLTSQVEFVKNEKQFLESPNDETVIVVLNQTEAIYCEDDSCNIDYCKTHNIPCIKMPQRGGCIIGVKGNVFITAKRKTIGGEALGDKFTKAFAKHLKDNRGLKSTRCDNNDILVDGYKVASAVETTINGCQYMCFQVSLYQDIETIKNVCNKPMVKIPKALSEYGITTDEMIDFIEEYWNNN